MSGELKKCPFCGCDGELLVVDAQVLALCSNDGCAAGINYRPVDEWNKRPLEDANASEVVRLSDIVELMRHHVGIAIVFYQKGYDKWGMERLVDALKCSEEKK